MSWCDVKILDFKDLDLEKGRLTYKRMKTSTKTNEDVIVYYPDYIKELLISRNRVTGLVFNLPSNNAANENLNRWMQSVGIEKKITWHCSRHTFGTISVKNSKNIYLTAKQMGHSSTKHTLRYLSPDEDQLIESSKLFQIN
jgi:integrase/recombinase XerD